MPTALIIGPFPVVLRPDLRISRGTVSGQIPRTGQGIEAWVSNKGRCCITARESFTTETQRNTPGCPWKSPCRCVSVVKLAVLGAAWREKGRAMATRLFRRIGFHPEHRACPRDTSHGTHHYFPGPLVLWPSGPLAFHDESFLAFPPIRTWPGEGGSSHGHRAFFSAPDRREERKLHHRDTETQSYSLGFRRYLLEVRKESLCPCVSVVKLSRTAMQNQHRVMRVPVMTRTTPVLWGHA